MDLLLHLHPATVHFPIALLWVTSAAGLVYLYWKPLPLLRALTWGTLAVGWIACGVAIFTGLLAQSGLPPQAPYRGVLNWHISAGLGVLVVYGAIVYLAWLAQRRPARRVRAGSGPASPPPADLLDDPARRTLVTVLLVAGALLVLVTGWNGGQLVYVWGVNVAP
ncbi:MAG: DUF2231 domain-containing protein [Caldilineaceae bacterium]